MIFCPLIRCFFFFIFLNLTFILPLILNFCRKTFLAFKFSSYFRKMISLISNTSVCNYRGRQCYVRISTRWWLSCCCYDYGFDARLQNCVVRCVLSLIGSVMSDACHKSIRKIEIEMAIGLRKCAYTQ